MYNKRPNLYIGFHGCDESIQKKLVLHPDNVRSSQEKFDWLGHGFYVWENNHERAMQWAQDKHKRGKISKPSVVGVLYQLDHCLDFTDSSFTKYIPVYYESMKKDLLLSGKEIPKNKDVPKAAHSDLVLRELDCAVIEYMHAKIEEEIKSEIKAKKYSELKRFDSVRGIFTEGGPVFEGAGIQSKNHIQICIRNLNCIKGFFIPRTQCPFP